MWQPRPRGFEYSSLLGKSVLSSTETHAGAYRGRNCAIPLPTRHLVRSEQARCLMQTSRSIWASGALGKLSGQELGANAPMAWVRTRLSAWGLLDAPSQRGGFTCLTTRLSSALKSSSPKNDMYPTHWHDITKSWDLSHRTRVVTRPE